MNEVLTTIDQCVEWARACRQERKTIGLVPTMGAFHEGHLSLVREAVAECDVVVVSVFVNPLQFGSSEDFALYPRNVDRDVSAAMSEGASVVFAPSEENMFPTGRPIITVDPGPLGDLLEGIARPGHFRGVATIVTKLFAVTSPDRAFFGEKDFEQLTMIRRLATDLGLPITIVGMPIVRERDGLAMSSRNQRLSNREREQACVLYRSLQGGAAYLHAGGGSLSELEELMSDIVMAQPDVTLDYATVRMNEDLSVPQELEGSLRLLVAAQVGPVRLIDNLAVDI